MPRTLSSAPVIAPSDVPVMLQREMRSPICSDTQISLPTCIAWIGVPPASANRFELISAPLNGSNVAILLFVESGMTRNDCAPAIRAGISGSDNRISATMVWTHARRRPRRQDEVGICSLTGFATWSPAADRNDQEPER